MRALKATLRKCQATLKPVFDRDYLAGLRWHAACQKASPAQLSAIQHERLAGLIEHFRHAGLYELPASVNLSMLRREGQLHNLPVLTRNGLHELFPRLEQMYQGRRDVFRHLTSGATAEPVEFFHSRRQLRQAGGCNLGMYLLLGWRPGMERLSLWGNYRDLGLEAKSPRGLKGRALNWLEATRRFGGYKPDDAEYTRFIDAVRASPGCAIFGFTLLLEDCARLMAQRGETLPQGHLATAWTCAEPLSASQRKLMQQVYNVPVREHYGSRECATIATECAQGNRHINPRYIVEVVGIEDDAPCQPGESGKLLITDLFNDATPLIRYQIGDLGAVEWRGCACGVSGPCLVELSGRVTDLIDLPSGCRVQSTVFMIMLQDIEGLKRFRVFRLGATEFEVKYTGRVLDELTVRQTEQLLSDAMEGAAIRLTHVTEIDPSPAGKLIQYVDMTKNNEEKTSIR